MRETERERDARETESETVVCREGDDSTRDKESICRKRERVCVCVCVIENIVADAPKFQVTEFNTPFRRSEISSQRV